MGRLNRVIIVLVAGTVWGCSSPRPPSPIVHLPPGAPILDKRIEGENSSEKLANLRDTVVRHAVKSIGTPYAWGGTSPSTGFDCSGLVGYTHAQAGIATPRTARALFRKGRPIRIADLTPGDLVFFSSPDKKTEFHVGIYIGKDIFVHAPGRGRRVRQAALTNPYFSQYFLGARTFL